MDARTGGRKSGNILPKGDQGAFQDLKQETEDMAFFGVTLETIGAIVPIPKADRIEMARLSGLDFQFVILKGQFKDGDKCLYFPIDSILPAPLIEKMGLTGKLAGKDRDRVKTVKLRGQVSQGLVTEVSLVPDEMARRGDPSELTAFLGVTKYEPPEIVCQDGILSRLPEGLSVYDIEGAERFANIVDLLMDQEVVVTEKVEGSNLSVACYPDGKDGSIFVNQRTATILPLPVDESSSSSSSHTFWKIAREQDLIGLARALSVKFGKPVAVYGEALGPGIQKNIYQLKGHKAPLYDIKVGHEWLAFDEYVGNLGGREAVPLLFRGKLRDFLAGKTIKEASDGKSMLRDGSREGIVVRPVKEQVVPEFGRLLIKQRSPKYLAEQE